MHRCEQSAGKFRVALVALHHPEPYHAQITGHRDIMAEIDGKRVCVEEAPWVGTEKPFEGELCIHEVQWLQESVPGKAYPMYWDFQMEKLP